jgi:hypothetical protein
MPLRPIFGSWALAYKDAPLFRASNVSWSANQRSRANKGVRCFVVETTKPRPPPPEDALDRMSRETDAILARSRALVKELEELLETGRQLRVAQQALLEQRAKIKGSK